MQGGREGTREGRRLCWEKEGMRGGKTMEGGRGEEKVGEGYVRWKRGVERVEGGMQVGREGKREEEEDTQGGRGQEREGGESRGVEEKGGYEREKRGRRGIMGEGEYIRDRKKWR